MPTQQSNPKRLRVQSPHPKDTPARPMQAAHPEHHPGMAMAPGFMPPGFPYGMQMPFMAPQPALHPSPTQRPRHQRHQVTKLVPVPDDFCGFVIGTKGSSIKKVKRDTGCSYIRCEKAEPDQQRPDPYFVVKGSELSVARATATILEMSMEAYRRSKADTVSPNEKRLQSKVDELVAEINKLQISGGEARAEGEQLREQTYTPQSPTYSPQSP